MAGMIDKVKAIMHKDKSHDDTTGTTHTGTHDSSTLPNTAAATTGHTGTGHHNTGVSTGLGTSGTHGERNPELTNTGLGSNTHGSTGLGSSNTHGSTGLGSSNTHDNTGLGSSNTHGSTGLGSSNTHGSTGLGSSNTHGSTGLGSSSTGYGSSDPSGPHNSHALNKADPRVDSDRYGASGNTVGAGGIGGGQYTEGSHGTHGTTGGLTGHSTTGGLGSTGSGLDGHGTADYDDRTGGAHNTRLGNVMHPHGQSGSTGAGLGNTGGLGQSSVDPRVDSDRYGSAGNTTGAGGVGAGQYSGNTHSSGLTGNTHGSGLTGNTHGSGLTGNTHGSGLTGSNTAGGLGHSSHNDPTGPHSSHLANSADPRVDSDRYVSGGNVGAGQYGNTHGSSGIGGTSGGYGDNTTGYSGATGEHAHTLPGEIEGTGRNNLSHRNNEDGALPKALTEDVSVAQPHSSLVDEHQHSTGTHGTHGGTTHDAHAKKPSMMDKLNPKKDADHDGKAGFMD